MTRQWFWKRWPLDDRGAKKKLDHVQQLSGNFQDHRRRGESHQGNQEKESNGVLNVNIKFTSWEHFYLWRKATVDNMRGPQSNFLS